MKALKLRDVHAAAGARFREEGERELVEGYGDVAGEVKALKTGAGLLDLSDLAKTRIDGRDRMRFINSMVTNEISKLEPGQGNYAMLLTNQGKLVADMLLYIFPDHFLMVQEEQVKGPGLAMLDRYLIADKVKFKDLSDDYGWLSVQGPGAGEGVARALEGVELPAEAHRHAGFKLGEAEGVIFREDRTGHGGFDLMVPAEGLAGLWEVLTRAGAKPAGRQAYDVVRIESAIPVPGRDMGEGTIPLEAGAGVERRGISHSKGCYIGQEVICRIKARGHVNWMLTAFKVDPEVAPGTRLYNGEKDVGWVTSVAESPELGRIGLGYVHRNARQIGGRLPAGAPGATLGVELHEPPLVGPAFEAAG